MLAAHLCLASRRLPLERSLGRPPDEELTESVSDWTDFETSFLPAFSSDATVCRLTVELMTRKEFRQLLNPLLLLTDATSSVLDHRFCSDPRCFFRERR